MRRIGRTDVTAPSNAGAELVATFATDPHGHAMFAGITNATLGHLGARPVLDARGGSWHGWTASPQAPMRGAGNLGSARPVVVPVSRLDQNHGYVPDNVQEMFAARMTSGRLS